METDELVDEGEADAGALVRPGPGASDPVEALEEVASSSLGMPVPVSRTSSSAPFPVHRRTTAISPSNVNLKAFERRLRTIFSHISRST